MLPLSWSCTVQQPKSLTWYRKRGVDQLRISLRPGTTVPLPDSGIDRRLIQRHVHLGTPQV